MMRALLVSFPMQGPICGARTSCLPAPRQQELQATPFRVPTAELGQSCRPATPANRVIPRLLGRVSPTLRERGAAHRMWPRAVAEGKRDRRTPRTLVTPYQEALLPKGLLYDSGTVSLSPKC